MYRIIVRSQDDETIATFTDPDKMLNKILDILDEEGGMATFEIEHI